ncbi:MAG: DEAD/DEAH box helicase family protein [Coriobacteriales bacterium]|nr:DEAD/DEAH box helicase family protein [Coriobacteriales bacterium]
MRELAGITLYDWQERCLDSWAANGYRGTVSVATGAGKTVLALAAIRLLLNGPIYSEGKQLSVKIIVPRIFLAQQWRAEIIRILGIPSEQIGLYYGAQKCDPSLPFVIYVLDSARHNVARHILADVKANTGGDVIEGASAVCTSGANTERSVFLICDEVHHFGSTENAHVFDFVGHIPDSHYFALGLSATPHCEHFNDRIAPAIGGIIFTYDIERASTESITASYHLFRVAVDLNSGEFDRYDELTDTIARVSARLATRCPELRRLRGREFFAFVRRLANQDGPVAPLARSLLSLILKRRAVVILAASRNTCALDLLSRLPYDTRIILFSERIRSDDELFTRLEALYPGRASRYHSLMEPETRQRALEAYRSGQTPVIVCCRALDEGLDVPLTDMGFIVSSGTNLRQRVQRMGRILRKSNTAQPKRIFYLYVPSTTENPELLWSDEADREGNAGTVAVPVELAGSDEAFEGAGEKGTPSASRVIESTGFDLHYDGFSQSLVNEDYDEIAARVMAALTSRKASPQQLKAASKQLRRGAIALDYLMEESECRALLNRAVREEKAYLQTMLLMIQEAAKGMGTVGE